MFLNLRKLTPVLMVGVLVLAGCDTIPESELTYPPQTNPTPPAVVKPATPAAKKPAAPAAKRPATSAVKPPAMAAVKAPAVPAPVEIPAAPTVMPPAAPAVKTPATPEPVQPSPQPVAAPHAESTFQFFLADMKAGPQMVEISGKNGSLYVNPNPVLSGNQVSESKVMTDNKGHYFVALRFTQEGARILKDISSKNQGKILAMAVNDGIIAVPRMTEPLNEGVLAFGAPSLELAQQIVSSLGGQTKPETMKNPPSTSAAPKNSVKKPKVP